MRYTIETMTPFTDLEEAMIEHFEMDPTGSILGWLLTLNDEEYHRVVDCYYNLQNRVEGNFHILAIFKRRPRIGDSMSTEDLQEAAEHMRSCLIYADLIRKGHMKNYTPGKNDNSWVFDHQEITEITKKVNNGEIQYFDR